MSKGEAETRTKEKSPLVKPVNTTGTAVRKNILRKSTEKSFPSMLHSLFVLSQSNGEVLIERHWRAGVTRSVCDEFWAEVTKSRSSATVPLFITTPRHYLVHIALDEVFLVGVLASESPPLLILEFLHRVGEVFTDYFGRVSVDCVKENFVIIYQLLDEMMDCGQPLNTEPNVLREMVMKPTMLNKMMDSMSTAPSTVSARLPEGSVSNIPWRKKGVRYAHNEIYFDIVESLDCIVNSNGNTIHTFVWGEIQCDCKLSGMPDLLLEFNEPRVLENFSFHPCVRYNRFLRNKQLSFVPPDGQFTLAKYNCQRSVPLPIYVKPQISISDRGDRVSVELMAGSRFVDKVNIQNIVVSVPFPKGLSSSSFKTNSGTAVFDEISKTLTWNIGKIDKQVTPQLTGSLIKSDPSAEINIAPVISVSFKMPKETLTGLKVDNLSILNEKYKPYKGMRSVTTAGSYEIRC